MTMAGIVGVSGPRGLMYFRDDFNRANSSTLGGDWRTDSGTASAQVASNAVQAITMSSNSGRNGNWHAYVDAVTLSGNGGRFLTDSYKVRAQLQAPTTSLATNNGTSIMLAVPDTYSSSTVIAYFGISTGSGSAIWTQQNAPSAPYAAISQTGQTEEVAASSPSNGTQTSLIEFERRWNVFNAWIDGSLTATWTDTAGLVPRGPTNRRFGFIVEGNYPIFQQQYDAPAINWIEAFDLGS